MARRLILVRRLQAIAALLWTGALRISKPTLTLPENGGANDTVAGKIGETHEDS